MANLIEVSCNNEKKQKESYATYKKLAGQYNIPPIDRLSFEDFMVIMHKPSSIIVGHIKFRSE